MPRYRISIKSHDREAMLDLVRVHKISVYDHGSRQSPSGEYSVDAAADAAQIRKLRAAGYLVDRHEDIDKVGRARQREVGKGDRYRDRPADRRDGDRRDDED
jgi:hypothetical protein